MEVIDLLSSIYGRHGDRGPSQRFRFPDIYSCAVCMEHLQDDNPRYLSCHHSFCQQCLQQLTRNGHVFCPTCRAVTAVPNNDVTKLTMNFQLVQMIEDLKQERDNQRFLQESVTFAMMSLCCIEVKSAINFYVKIVKQSTAR